jgi:hypothetical protein
VIGKYEMETIPLFATATAINVALFASNVFQDNLSSVTWCWLGVLWYFAHKRWRLQATSRERTWQLHPRHEPVGALARRP